MFVLKGILRAESQEKILLYLLARKKGYGKAIADCYQIPLNPVQKQLVRLEEDGVIVSHTLGNVREYELNPRYAFITPLKSLLKAALAAYPPDQQQNLLMNRRRPRKAEKPVKVAEQAND